MEGRLSTHGPYKAVKDAVSVADVASRYTTLEPFGGNAWYTARCPLPDHDDRRPSFYVYPADDAPGGRWHCYGCGRGGDVIDLEKHCGDHAESWTAMLQLSYDFGVELPARPAAWFRRQERQHLVRDALSRVKADVLRRRLFRFCVLPLIDATILDPTEHREEVRRAWADWEAVPDALLLDLAERRVGDRDAA